MWVYCDRDHSNNSNNSSNSSNSSNDRVVLFARGAGATALVTGAAKNVGKYHDDHDDHEDHEREERKEREGKDGTTQEEKEAEQEAEQEQHRREDAAFQWSLYLQPAKEGYRLTFQTSASKEVVAQKEEEVSTG